MHENPLVGKHSEPELWVRRRQTLPNTSGAHSRTRKSGTPRKRDRGMGILNPTGTRLGDRHKINFECDQKNRVDVFEHSNCESEKSGDCCESEKILPESCSGPGPWEQDTNPRSLRGNQVGKNAGGCVCCERPKETRRTRREERGRSTPVTAIQMVKRENCLQSHRSGCGKCCCGRFHGGKSISVGTSCGETCVDKCVEETQRCLDRNDHVTKRECLDPCKMSDHWTTVAILSKSFKSLFA